MKNIAIIVTDQANAKNDAMTGNPLWDFIAFDQLFNKGGSSSGGNNSDDENSKWALVITVIIFVIFFIYICFK